MARLKYTKKYYLRKQEGIQKVKRKKRIQWNLFRNKKFWKKALISTAVATASVATVASVPFSTNVVFGGVYSLILQSAPGFSSRDEQIQRVTSTEQYNAELFNGTGVDNEARVYSLSIPADDGVIIQARAWANQRSILNSGSPNPNQQTYVVGVVDYGMSMESVWLYVQPFINLGYSAVIYSPRGTSETGGVYTFGNQPQNDLSSVVNYLSSSAYNRISFQTVPLSSYAIIGLGLGAVTATLYAENIATQSPRFMIMQNLYLSNNEAAQSIMLQRYGGVPFFVYGGYSAYQSIFHNSDPNIGNLDILSADHSQRNFSALNTTMVFIPDNNGLAPQENINLIANSDAYNQNNDIQIWADVGSGVTNNIIYDSVSYNAYTTRILAINF